MNFVLLEGLLSVVGNIVLFAFKLWAGIVTGSIALMADAWHTLSDSCSSGIVIFSGWASARPADEKHPFGHGRIDLICSVVIGILLSMVGLEFIIEALEQLRNGETVVFGRFAIVVTITSILGKELMAQFAFWTARKSGNSILRADAWHHRTDALSSVIVLAGILCSDFLGWIDGVLGILVALMIFYASFQILKDSVTRLIGEEPDPDFLREVKDIVNTLAPEVDPHHFHLHRYGEHLELTFHISMAADMTLSEAHEQAHRIENTLRNQMNLEATIHMEPKQEIAHENS